MFAAEAANNGPHRRSRPAADVTPEVFSGVTVINRMDAVVGRNDADLSPTSIVMHYTAGHSGDASIGVLASRGLSYHFVIERNGAIKQLVRSNIRAIHDPATNVNTIGIAFANLGFQEEYAGRHESPPIADWISGPRRDGADGKWEPYPLAQIAAGQKLVAALKIKYPAIADVVGHSDTSSSKDDPGPAFPISVFNNAVA